MPDAKELHEALGILLKYTKDTAMSAEHDEVYLSGPEPDGLTHEDQERLMKLRVTWDEGVGSWHAFV